MDFFNSILVKIDLMINKWTELKEVPIKISFPEEESKIQELWKSTNAFEKSLEQSKDKPMYSFYDGPPFATGLPHYGHILAGTIKVKKNKNSLNSS